MAAQPDPFYDLLSLLPAGVELTRDIQSGLAAAYAGNHFQPLSGAQIVAVTGPALPYPAGLTRFPPGWV